MPRYNWRRHRNRENNIVGDTAQYASSAGTIRLNTDGAVWTTIDNNSMMNVNVPVETEYGDDLNGVLNQMANTIEGLQLRVAELEARV